MEHTHANRRMYPITWLWDVTGAAGGQPVRYYSAALGAAPFRQLSTITASPLRLVFRGLATTAGRTLAVNIEYHMEKNLFRLFKCSIARSKSQMLFFEAQTILNSMLLRIYLQSTSALSVPGTRTSASCADKNDMKIKLTFIFNTLRRVVSP